ncbi:unnamed protein product, partial [Discosporangium mesarthrocarpum]
RAEFPFSYRRSPLMTGSIRSGAGAKSPPTPVEAAAAAADAASLCRLHEGIPKQQQPLHACVFEHMSRNAIFRRMRLPHRFQVLVRVDLLGLKNLSPHYQPSRIDVFASIALKRPEPPHLGLQCYSPGHHHHRHRAPPRAAPVAGAAGGGAQGWGRDSAVTSIKRLVPSANGQASQQSRWGAAATFRFALPEGSLPHILGYGSQVFRLVMGDDDSQEARGGGAGSGGGPPRVVRIAVWRKHLFSEQWLGDVDVPLNGLDDRDAVEDWVLLQGDKGASWFVNIRLTLRFVMMCVTDTPHEEEYNDDDEGSLCEDKNDGLTLSGALGDVDVI